MTLTKENWLELYGWCETLENTPAKRTELAEFVEGPSNRSRVWSEFERHCEAGEYFAGTCWTEVILGIYADAARLYLREKPAQHWILVSGRVEGRRNRNSYHCETCDHQWTDEYPGAPDDDCDRCGNRHCQPSLIEELDAQGSLVRTWP